MLKTTEMGQDFRSYYDNLIHKLRDRIKEKRWENLRRGVLLLQENAATHTFSNASPGMLFFFVAEDVHARKVQVLPFPNSVGLHSIRIHWQYFVTPFIILSDLLCSLYLVILVVA